MENNLRGIGLDWFLVLQFLEISLLNLLCFVSWSDAWKVKHVFGMRRASISRCKLAVKLRGSSVRDGIVRQFIAYRCKVSIPCLIVIMCSLQMESKCALVYGQMNEPPGARARVGLTGLTVAEHFRDAEGQDVLFFIDNIFRFTQVSVRASCTVSDRRCSSNIGV